MVSEDSLKINQFKRKSKWLTKYGVTLLCSVSLNRHKSLVGVTAYRRA